MNLIGIPVDRDHSCAYWWKGFHDSDLFVTTLKTLSEHLGLSLATVSRAVNGHSAVSPATREKVLRAARELNYRANSSARRLATGKTGAYGIIMQMGENLLLDSQFPDFMAGLTEALARKDRDVVLGAARTDQTLPTYERFARAGKVDGFVVTQPVLSDPRVTMLEALGMPFVVHGRTGPTPSHAFYDIDNQGAFRQATDLLVQLGHRRIALLNGKPDAMFAIHRRDGFRAALPDGMFRPEMVFETEMTEEQGVRCMRRALDSGATAVLCSSVLLALGAERAIQQAGLTIGNDISVISHDDGLTALRTDHFSVPLTVTRAPIRDAGEAIAAMLDRLAEGQPPESLQTIAPVDLILRGSTKAPPRR
jgi:LacI family transcriptional regulator